MFQFCPKQVGNNRTNRCIFSSSLTKSQNSGKVSLSLLCEYFDNTISTKPNSKSFKFSLRFCISSKEEQSLTEYVVLAS